MLRTLKNRTAKTGERDQGFTLIELMVVVMIIAVLLAIAIPTFLGSQNKAKDRSAQSSLRNTVTAARTIYTDTGDYSTVSDSTLTPAEKSLTFVAGGTASASPRTVSVTTLSGVFYAAAMSDSKVCFFIKDDPNSGTTYAKPGTGTACSGTAASTASGFAANGWS